MQNRLEPQDPRSLLRRHDLRPKRSYSQNFLISPGVVEQIARHCVAAAMEGTPWVIEFGAGLGALTVALINRGADVLAIEPDLQLLQVLRAEYGAHPHLTLQAGDATTFDITAAAQQRTRQPVVTGNLPYAVSNRILRQLCVHASAIRAAIVMVQREVADRLIAPPANRAYGALTVFASNHFRIERLLVIKPGAFHPAPKVQSAVVALYPRPQPITPEDDAFRMVVAAAFGSRRKQIHNALAKAPQLAGQPVAAWLDACGIRPECRGETLSVEQFACLAERLRSHTTGDVS